MIVKGNFLMLSCTVRVVAGNFPMLYCAVKTVTYFSIIPWAVKIVARNFLMLCSTVRIVTGNFPMLYYTVKIYLCFTPVKTIKTSQETRNFFGAEFLFAFGALSVPFWNIRSFLSLWHESLFSWNIRNILRVVFFHFSILESYFIKYKRNVRLESSIPRNIRKLYYTRVENMSFLKYKKSLVKLGF